MQVAKAYGIQKSTVCRMVKRTGVNRRRAAPRRKYSIDERAFDVIGEHSAYWAGFFFADGTIAKRNSSRNSNIFKVALASADYGHVKEFRNFLKSTHPIKTYTSTKKGVGGGPLTNSGIRISSKPICERLRQLGWRPRNTGKAAKELAISRHFWRGLIDGDGHLGITKGKAAYFELAAGRDLLIQFSEFCQRFIHYSCKSRPCSNTILRTSFTGEKAAELIKVLYNNSTVSLPRKFIQAQFITH